MNVLNIVSFKGIYNVQNKNNDGNIKKDRLKDYVKEALSSLAEDGERSIPENGRFSPRAVYLNVAGTQNNGRIAVEYDPREPKTQRLLNVGVSRKGTDKIISRYPVVGTKAEILNYLKDKKSIDEIHNHIVELSDKVDKQYN